LSINEITEKIIDIQCHDCAAATSIYEYIVKVDASYLLLLPGILENLSYKHALTVLIYIEGTETDSAPIEIACY